MFTLLSSPEEESSSPSHFGTRADALLSDDESDSSSHQDNRVGRLSAVSSDETLLSSEILPASMRGINEEM